MHLGNDADGAAIIERLLGMDVYVRVLHEGSLQITFSAHILGASIVNRLCVAIFNAVHRFHTISGSSRGINASGWNGTILGVKWLAGRVAGQSAR
jgi:hypothetical protein